MSELPYRAPLGAVALDGPELRIVEKPFQGILELRGDPADAVFMGAVTEAVGAALPTVPLSSVEHDGLRLLWMRPDGWLLCGTPDAADALEARLRAALAGSHHAVLAVGHRFVAFTLSGCAARVLLAKGTPLDLHARAFPPGRVARTLLAGQTVIIHAMRDEASYDLYCDVSMASFMWAWLRDAALEFRD